MRASGDYRYNNSSWEDTPPICTECGLYFCAKAYESIVKNGQLEETGLGTWAVREPQSWKAPDYQREPGSESTEPEGLKSWDDRNPDFDLTTEK